jgi:16S rRNA G966 N2-methylase RsmD
MADYDIRKEFPKRPGVSWQQLVKTPEAEYSITRHAHALEIHSVLRKACGNLEALTVADGTANIGSDVIRFGIVCSHVYAVELDKATFEALKSNIRVYKLQQRITALHGDCTEVLPKLLEGNTIDMVYLDPPWGGPSYKDSVKLDLTLGTKRVDAFVEELVAAKDGPRWVVLKVPNNYNAEKLFTLPKVKVTQHAVGRSSRKPSGAFQLYIIASAAR